MLSKRKRTSSEHIYHGLYLYFLVSSSEILSKHCPFYMLSIEVTLQLGIGFKSINLERFSTRRTKISEYIIDETLIKVGPEHTWLWTAIEPENRQILALSISKKRNMLIAERFLSGLVKIHGKDSISTDGGTWYPMAYRFLKLKHHFHSSLEKSLIERTMQYIKDRTECFDDYFPCSKEKCKLNHVKNWLNLFVKIHNKEVLNA